MSSSCQRRVFQCAPMSSKNHALDGTNSYGSHYPVVPWLESTQLDSSVHQLTFTSRTWHSNFWQLEAFPNFPQCHQPSLLKMKRFLCTFLHQLGVLFSHCLDNHLSVQQFRTQTFTNRIMLKLRWLLQTSFILRTFLMVLLSPPGLRG